MLETDKIAVVGFLNGKKKPRMKILSWRKFKNKPMFKSNTWNIVLLFAIFLLHVRLSVELECHFKSFKLSSADWFFIFTAILFAGTNSKPLMTIPFKIFYCNPLILILLMWYTCIYVYNARYRQVPKSIWNKIIRAGL